MFHYEYVTTKDRKGNVHRYKLATGESLPEGHKEVARTVALLTHSVGDARMTALR